MTEVRVRIGPSPTGDPHVGTAYIALFNLVFARQHGGKFVLRIEDTDQERSRPAWEGMIIDALSWLDLKWDEGPDVGGPYGPYRQSERGPIYAEHVAQLVNKGAAYPCFCTSERLDAVRKKQREEKLPLGYDGHCRDLDAAEVKRLRAEGQAEVIRLKVPKEETTVFEDALRGEVRIENKQVDDQVLLKSDGLPTYHLANVVDDHLMKITHVMRAEEWISSTPKHVLLYKAFGWEPPTFVHMPLLRNSDKSKISKRKNPVSLNYYREAGFSPAAMRNYLGMMGWTMPDEREIFGFEDMVEHFSFDRMSLGGPVFDVQKLTWLNGQYLREGSAQDMLDGWRGSILTDAKLLQVAELLHERVEKLEDFITQAAFFFSGDLTYDEAAMAMMVPKKRTKEDVIKAFEAMGDKIDAMASVDAERLEAAAKEVLAEQELKPKDLFMPMRIAVTGTKASPDLFRTMGVLGKEKCRRRLRLAVGHLKGA